MLNETKHNVACWDDSNSDIGIYCLMLNGDEILRIEEVEKYLRNCSRKPKCKYLMDMCIWGSSHSHELAAKTIAEAKNECETWLAQNLKNRIEGLQKSIHYFQNLLGLLT